jgi:hypothetical protein
MNRKLEIIIKGGPRSGKSVIMSMIWYLLQKLGDFNITVSDGDKTSEELDKTYRKVLFTKDIAGDQRKTFFKDIDIDLKTEVA